ncbi:hypothetical protein [Terriglobus tenax]|uniref:hypothetical protein n=1 Tax=Terriglobus tenax TaxID=1111115 RepID=UPI0021DFAFA2|nr:hypothetical protein [Terriglobus tenax]
MKASPFCVLMLSLVWPIYSALSQQRAFSVVDDIAMVRFSDPSPEESDAAAKSASMSPDGRHIAVVTTRGLLDSNRIESRISVFAVSDIQRLLRDPLQKSIQPRLVATIASFPHHEQTVPYAPVIKDLRWSANGKLLYFRGESLRGAYQLYRANTDGSGFHRLTPETFSVNQFDMTNSRVVYTSARIGLTIPERGTILNADALDVTGSRLINILFPGQMASYEPERFTLSFFEKNESKTVPHHVPGFSVAELSTLLHFLPFRVSPDRRYVLLTAPAESVPDHWRQYDPAPSFEHRRLSSNDPDLVKANNPLRPRRYSLIDLATGKLTPLLDSPNAWILGYFADSNNAAWADDSSRVLVTNTFYPQAPDEANASEQHPEPCAVASVDLPNLKPRCLFFETKHATSTSVHVDDVSFGHNRDEAQVLLRTGGAQYVVKTYVLQGKDWKPVAEGPVMDTKPLTFGAPRTHSGSKTPPRVFVKQGLNERPTLWAKDPNTGAARQIWDPNPQLQHVNLGEASVYHWKDESGSGWTGGLVKPVSYVAGQRYPLVIQMYQFHENQFLTDGTDPTAFAARQLASAGFMVLQIRKRPSVLSEEDPKVHLEAYRSAIKSLSDAGLVDASNVGVVGFSWTCWYVINALIKAPQLFRAATIADGLDNSYMQYLIFGPGPPVTHEQMDTIRGTSPFAAGLQKWVEDAPGFHLDQVQTPVRIEAINPSSILQEWELYASLAMQHKPVDMIYFPAGTHIHQRPLERLESQQGNIDWLRFWMQGYEDPAPRKRAQYERWHMLKESLKRDRSGMGIE